MPGRPGLSCLGCQICPSRACAPSHLNSQLPPLAGDLLLLSFLFPRQGPCSLGPRSVPSRPPPPITLTADDPPVPPPMGVLTVRRGSLQKIARNVCNLATLVRANPSLAQRMHELHLDTANLVSSAAVLHIALARKHWTRARTVQTVRTRVASEGGGVTASASPTHPPSKRASASTNIEISTEGPSNQSARVTTFVLCVDAFFRNEQSQPRAKAVQHRDKAEETCKEKAKTAASALFLSSTSTPPGFRSALPVCTHFPLTYQADLLPAGITTRSPALHGSLNLPSHISHIA